MLDHLGFRTAEQAGGAAGNPRGAPPPDDAPQAPEQHRCSPAATLPSFVRTCYCRRNTQLCLAMGIMGTG